ncbi:MAG: enoyl-CoA hydratase-related protein [Desulfatiglandaceae bacterium]
MREIHHEKEAVGPARTMELLMSGRIFGAEEAFQLGVVNRVVPEEHLITQTMGLADRIAAMPSQPIRVVKCLTYQSPSLTVKDLARKQAREQSLCYEGPDVAEGICAAQERRAPRFHL